MACILILQRTSANPSPSINMPTGQLKTINDFYIPQLKTKRRVWIYLPPDYENSQKRYPVLYMQDGQSLFDEKTAPLGSWSVDRTMEKLFNEKKTEGLIIIAVDNAGKNRMREYNPWEDLGGRGELYADFIANTLKPYVDDNFRTKPQREFTGIMGSSMGAYISAYIGLKYQDTFSKVGLLSPVFWLYTDQLRSFFEDLRITKSMKIYLSVGTKESDEARSIQYLEETRSAYDVMGSKMIHSTGDNKNIRLDVIQDGTHSGSEWSKVFEISSMWLF